MVDRNTQPDAAVRNTLRAGGVETDDEIEQKRTTKAQPSYQVVGETRIPVSKQHGKLWKARRDASMGKRKSQGVEDSWDEALKYYHHDQLSHRNEGTPDRSQTETLARRRNGLFTETENIVFANTTALASSIYAKNPRIEVTTAPDYVELEPVAELGEELVNLLFAKKSAPGVNIKPKARRAVVMSSLTNKSWLMVNYVFKDQSSEQSLAELQDVAEKLAKAKTKQEIMDLEGKLQALEYKVGMLEPEGPTVNFMRPHDVLVDPNCEEDDLSDAMWAMYSRMLPTEFINAHFGTEKRKQQYESIFKPSHVLKTSAKSSEQTLDDEVNSFTLLDEANLDDWKKHGFDDEEGYRTALRTKVWYVWDKVTRRVYLYNDKDWQWPLWVWDDPLHLDTFFPLFPLSFYTSPEGGDAKGEVTYYLDQQDAINEINDEERRMRLWVRRMIAYNKNRMDPETFAKIIKGDLQNGIALDLQEGEKVTDVLAAIAPPSANYVQLFNIERKLAAIDRISSVNDVMRGAQFKTNTTNDAIEQYSRAQSSRLDDRVDQVEDLIGGVGWAILQMCLQFMDRETVAQLVGPKRAEKWVQIQDPKEIHRAFNVRVVGGTSQKPTSQAKKKEAIEVGQVLGQFARATPAAVIVAMKVLSRAFDELVISDSEWEMIIQSTMQQLQRGGPGQGGEEGGRPEEGAGGGPGGGAGGDIEQVREAVRSLPPQAKQMLQQLVEQGMKPGEALQQVTSQMQNG